VKLILLSNIKILGLSLEEIIDGKNHRRRPRLEYISQMIEDQGCKSYQELKWKNSDGETWKLLQNQSLY